MNTQPTSASIPRERFAHDAQPLWQEHLLDFRMFASLRRMVSHQLYKPLVGRLEFVRQVTLYLPEVAARIEESDFGIVHLEVGAMKLATRYAISHRDFATVRKHLSLIADLFDRADAELHDAICISYLEGLFLGDTSDAFLEAHKLLPYPMKSALGNAELRQAKRYYSWLDEGTGLITGWLANPAT